MCSGPQIGRILVHQTASTCLALDHYDYVVPSSHWGAVAALAAHVLGANTSYCCHFHQLVATMGSHGVIVNIHVQRSSAADIDAYASILN